MWNPVGLVQSGGPGELHPELRKPSPGARPRLELRGIGKWFGGTRALHAVSLELSPGEVHVLAGENGAGKSTLIRILSGVYADYAGELRLDGEPVRFTSPAEARARGIVTIHQELSLVPNLSVMDNLWLGTPGRPWAPVSRARARQRANAVLAGMKLELDPERLVEQLSLSERQLLEIARALAEDARILILDEPTSALSEPDTERLFSALSEARARGTSLLYISHRMEEVRRIADRISVLRDGALVVTRPAAELADAELVFAMVGRELGQRRVHRSHSQAELTPCLEVQGLVRTAEPALRGVDFTLAQGEVLGFGGLAGSGASAVLATLFEGGRGAGGRIRLAGEPYTPRSPRHALERGLALVPSDRARSILPELSVVENASLASLARYSRAGWLARRAERAEVGARMGEVGLRAPSLAAPASTLSGGNQQKLALLRCLLTRPKLLLLDDPTRGVDVGAKAEIYELVAALAESGAGVVLVSSELDELLALCDRILVLRRGRIAAALERGAFARDRLLAALIGADDSAVERRA